MCEDFSNITWPESRVGLSLAWKVHDLEKSLRTTAPMNINEESYETCHKMSSEYSFMNFLFLRIVCSDTSILHWSLCQIYVVKPLSTSKTSVSTYCLFEIITGLALSPTAAAYAVNNTRNSCGSKTNLPRGWPLVYNPTQVIIQEASSLIHFAKIPWTLLKNNRDIMLYTWSTGRSLPFSL